ASLVLGFAKIYLVWGSTYLANRIAIETLPPFLMPGLRFLIAGSMLTIGLVVSGNSWPTPRQWRDNALVGVLLLVGGTGLVVWGQQFIPSGLTALIIGASPLFFAIVEWVWPGGQPPTRWASLALLIGFGGVTWLAAPWQGTTEGGLAWGPTCVILIGSVLWAIGSIFSRHLRERAPPLVGATIQMLVGGSVLVLISAVRGEWDLVSWHTLSGRSLGALGYLVIIGSLVAFPTFVWLMQHCPPSRVSTYAYVNPVVAVALGWLIMDEPVTARTLAAAVVILGAVAMITALPQRKTPAVSLRSHSHARHHK
ncbi:MAG TPA: EamA family transporter, partial [Opitutaceae bacterium]|nr:EamA family transporter [Opitutaceae bacterium]